MHYYICRGHKAPALWVSSKHDELCVCGKQFEQITKSEYLTELKREFASDV
jgi:hypothetical protein